MKMAAGWRVLFGVSAVGFGVIALKWHDADTWQQLFAIFSVPLGGAIGVGLMAALIAGGIAIYGLFLAALGVLSWRMAIDAIRQSGS